MTIFREIKMDIIKQFCKYKKATIIVIYTNCYCRNLKYILMLRDELEKDFPNLIDNSIVEIKIYGGMTIKGILGLEITFREIKVPKSYKKVATLESTLS